MITCLFHRTLNRIRRLLLPNPNAFLRSACGVIHVGANEGQERDVYEAHNLHVVWIEPIPAVFTKLSANISALPKQTAVQGLVSESCGQVVNFNVANNGGASSSIFDLHLHRKIWPEIEFTSAIPLTTTTLPDILQSLRSFDFASYDTLVLDTQGAELLVLRGAESILPNFRFISLEAPDFEAYSGCCQLSEIGSFLLDRGFSLIQKVPFATNRDAGTYYNVLFERR